MPEEFTPEQIAEFQAAFDKFDKNNDKSISVTELKDLMDSLEIPTTENELKDLV
jgi:Ca2+-binding EF-hand superfamily protein